ncbi:hypothetical protein BDF14DRAFT_1821672 [Spinellus fusiger]|nr:hypothetical protein BDF14DRAFT_1821672 [Spinellus fusiger]
MSELIMSKDRPSIQWCHGLNTPQSSQEENIYQKMLNVDMTWPDTDASEDEDFLPQNQHICLPSPTRAPFKDSEDTLERKRSRTNSLGVVYDTRELLRRRVEDECCIADLSHERVCRVIDQAIDNGLETIDFSHLNLTEIPQEISELRHITIFHKDRKIVKPASLEVFLYSNSLTVLSPSLFKLKNLTVLSLRNNRLTSISPDISLLVNLEELSIGNNHLSCIPSELTNMPKLATLSLCPNPYLSCPDSTLPHKRLLSQSVPTLVEIASRQWLASDSNTSATGIAFTNLFPCVLQSRLNAISPTNHCFKCQALFEYPCSIDILWCNVLNIRNIPVEHRFCSLSCSNSYISSVNLIKCEQP